MSNGPFVFLFFPRLAMCDGMCQNGGTCVSPNNCICQQGFTGRRCETGKRVLFLVPLDSFSHVYLPFSLAFALALSLALILSLSLSLALLFSLCLHHFLYVNPRSLSLSLSRQKPSVNKSFLLTVLVAWASEPSAWHPPTASPCGAQSGCSPSEYQEKNQTSNK